MKKIYFLFAMVFFAYGAMAQIDVTFAVDMTGQTVSENGVHVAGDWQSEANGGDDWQPGENMLADDDADGIYTLTVSIPAGGYQFKFINDNTWGGVEGVPAVSQVGFGNDNRYFQVTEASNTLYPVPFSGSAMTGMSAVKLMVDMADQTVEETGAHVAGDMFDPVWTPEATPLYNLSNAVYGVTVQVADGDYNYKFLRSNAWGTDESAPDDCGSGGNRTITVAGDVEEGPNCFGACGPCAVPTDITFKVDMSQSCQDLAAGVNLMGTATDWGTGAAMDDSDGDMVYELTVGLQPGDYEFKFRVGEGGWEGIGNRPLTVVDGEAQVLPAVCFNSSEECPAEFWDPADVLFGVDMSEVAIPEGHLVWLMGDFTEWQAGALQMTLQDGKYWVTVPDFCQQSGAYKFAYGIDPANTASDWVEETADFSELGDCGIDNPGFSDNRIVTRTSNDAMSTCHSFDSCDECPVGLVETESLNKVQVYPNPVVGDINIAFEVSGMYTIQIMDVTGKVVVTTAINGLKAQIGSENLNTGVYFVQISDAYNNVVTKKIVK